MIKVHNVETWGFKHSVRGMRNSYNSWDKSDSFKCDSIGCYFENCPIYNKDTEGCSHEGIYIIGRNDLELMRKLIKAGQSHRKFLRQIFVSMDITAPLYWWKEFDTYKIGVTANSCSTMHTICEKEFTLEDFSVGHLNTDVLENPFKTIIDCLNFFRELYVNNKNKDDWWQIIQLLPASYNQKRTVTMNYENIFNIIKQRKNHKLDEWKIFIKIIKDLPYVKEFTQEN